MAESSIPSESECLELLSRMNLPSGVINHSVSVKNAALQFADEMEARGIRINRDLIAAAALLHDIMKIDAHFCHGIEGGQFLRKSGFPEVASVVEKHCLVNLNDPALVPKTAEEKLLMYADLRVTTGKIVSLDERFSNIRQRYRPKDENRWAGFVEFARRLEIELLGDKRE